jgi:hypothetical protein
MATGAEIIEQIRDALDEATESQWSNPQIRRWINRGLRDIARVTRHFQDRITVSLTAGVSEYAIPANVLEVTDAFFLPGDGRSITLTARQYESMRQVWGDRPNSTSFSPQVFSIWGYSPNLRIVLYPVPERDITNGLALMVVRTPVPLNPTGSQDSAQLDFPDTWMDALVHFAESQALRNDRDPRWQEAYQLYQEVRDQLTVMGDYMVVNREFVRDPHVGDVPRWLAAWD